MRFLLGLGLVLGVAFAALGLPAAWALVVRLAEHDRAAAVTIAIGFAGGGAAGVLSRWVPGLRFADVLCHELSHASWALLVGGSVASLHASADAGGHTQSVLPRSFRGARAFLVTIGPYWYCPLIPLALALLLALEPLSGNARFVAAVVFGFLVLQPLLQWHVSQPDLRAYRVVAPIAVAGLLLAGIGALGLAAIATGGSRGLHLVYVASCEIIGIPNAELTVRRTSASLSRLLHPAWLDMVQASSASIAGVGNATRRGSDERKPSSKRGRTQRSAAKQ